MPFYEYLCTNCSNKLEELQKMSDPPLKKCPKCGKNTLKRLIGTGGGIIFKGSGFYQTDYKKEKKPEEKKPEEKKSAEKKSEQSKASNEKTSAELPKPNKKDTKKKDK